MAKKPQLHKSHKKRMPWVPANAGFRQRVTAKLILLKDRVMERVERMIGAIRGRIGIPHSP